MALADLLPDLARLSGGGTPVGRAVVTRTWGSSPRPAGACLLATADARLAGSVSGGCVEVACAHAVARAIAEGAPHAADFGVSHDVALGMGLACGGRVTVWVEPAVRPELAALAATGGGVCSTLVEGRAAGVAFLWHDDGTVTGPLPAPGREADPAALAVARALEDAIVLGAREAYAVETSRAEPVKHPDWTEHVVFHEVLPRPPVLVIVGAVHVAQHLVPLARRLGHRVVVTDARSAFATPDRFPEADAVLPLPPAEAFARVGLTRATSVCVLSHDPKWDEPAIEHALRSPARYVGAIGSAKTQQERRARLRAAGLDEVAIARLHGPIGLDLGGRTPAETALAILAEITAVRYGAAGGSLSRGSAGHG